jgi:hypothetical protein
MGWFWSKSGLNKDVKEVVVLPKKEYRRRWTDTIEGRVWELNFELDSLIKKVKEGVGYER